MFTHLGVHRNSLYKTFGSKRGLYLTALRWHLKHRVHPLIAEVGAARDIAQAVGRALAARDEGTDTGPLDLLLMAATERAPVDQEVRAEVSAAVQALDRAVTTVLTRNPHDLADEPTTALAEALTSALLGLRLRARATTADPDHAAAALARHLNPTPSS